jgi:AraC-like DNA-binding protein
MDVLADILSVTRLTGDVFSHTFCDPPWGLRYEPAPDVWFHIVATGTCQLIAGADRPRVLATNDLVLLPHGTGHRLCDAPASPCLTVNVARARARGAAAHLTMGPDGPRRPPNGRYQTEVLCGSYSLAFARVHPVLRLLPPVIHIPGRHSAAHAGLQSTIQQLVAEFGARDVGSSKVVSRLLDVLFVHVLRYWLDTQPASKTGWLGGLRDESLGRALVAMHTAPAKPWTVRSLAASAGLSRPVFARRFTTHVGTTPLGYLRDLRIDLASRLLRETDQPIASIAASVGYTSEFAFNRAFQRVRGTPPGRFRRASG